MGVAQVFVGKIFVHRLQTTKSTKILPLENYPLYGSLNHYADCLAGKNHHTHKSHLYDISNGGWSLRVRTADSLVVYGHRCSQALLSNQIHQNMVM